MLLDDVGVATQKPTIPASLPLPVVGVWDGPLVPTTYGALSVYHYSDNAYDVTASPATTLDGSGSCQL